MPTEVQHHLDKPCGPKLRSSFHFGGGQLSCLQVHAHLFSIFLYCGEADLRFRPVECQPFDAWCDMCSRLDSVHCLSPLLVCVVGSCRHGLGTSYLPKNCVLTRFKDAGDDAPSQKEISNVLVRLLLQGTLKQFNITFLTHAKEQHQHIDKFSASKLFKRRHRSSFVLLKLYTQQRGTTK